MVSTRIVGELACQRDSYLKELVTTVISCVPVKTNASTAASGNSQAGAKPKKGSKSSATAGKENVTAPASAPLWEIEFEDTVLFPEGGGQPTDHGTLTAITNTNATNDTTTGPPPPPLPPPQTIPITRINRHGLRAVHFSPTPLPIGTQVTQRVNFDRRMDHMQQHTGQHLLSAIMDTYDGLETLGWSMGASIVPTDANPEGVTSATPNMNFIELGRKPSDAELEEIQRKCNEVIARNVRISVDTPANAKSDSIPADYDQEKGVIRVIKIEGIDENTCCGTHLSQTSHISLILLHHTQPIRGTNTRLYFTCGSRATQLASSSIRSLRSISTVVSAASPSDSAERVEKMSNQLRDVLRLKRKLEIEIATYEAQRVKLELDAGAGSETDNSTIRGSFVYRVCDDGMDYITALTTELKDLGGYDRRDNTFVLLVAPSEIGGGGPAVIVGDEKAVAKAVESVKRVVPDIKGGGKGNRWQGKMTKLGTAQVKALRGIVEGGGVGV